MTENVPNTDPWTAPPDWVHLPELSDCIERRFGILGPAMLPQIISDLRSDRLRHRVEWPQALLDQTVSLRGYRYETVLPPGLSKAEKPSRVRVHDWELAQIDWGAGTVGGLPPDYSGPKWPDEYINQRRLKIEVQWSHVEWVYSLYKIDERRQSDLTQSAASPFGTTASATGKANRGGRPPVFDWDSALRELLRHASLDGLQSRSKATAHLLAWFAGRNEHPSDSVVREKIAHWWPKDLPET